MAFNELYNTSDKILTELYSLEEDSGKSDEDEDVSESENAVLPNGDNETDEFDFEVRPSFPVSDVHRDEA